MQRTNSQCVLVSTPSRLHFGLLRFAQVEGPSFGGLGMMIDRPRIELQLKRACEWRAVGLASQRARAFAEKILGSLHGVARPTALHIDVRACIPQHRGLGSGTQLALAVAAGLSTLLDLGPIHDIGRLVSLVGRGQRSAVGSHGFAKGGLIWELGRRPNEALAPLATRVVVPAEWRVVLVSPHQEPGRSGQRECDAFQALPPVAPSTSQRLVQLAEERILPAAACADLDAFGDAVYGYGRLAGECFAPVQGGPYASREIASCVAAIRAMGVRGVGQSSWGPTVFAIVGSQADAESLAADLVAQPPIAGCDVVISRPDNCGALVTHRES